MAETAGWKVPTNKVACGSGHLIKKYVAEGAITPTNLVGQGTAVYQVVVNASALTPLGVADLNPTAYEDGENPLTHAYAAGDSCMVILTGAVVVVGDTAGFTQGLMVQTGTGDNAEVEDRDTTAASAADTYKSADFTTILAGIRGTIGIALTTAATGVKGIILLGR